MKLRNAFLILCAAAVLAAGEARAADTVAVINYQQILHDSSAGKSVKEQLDAKQRSFQAEMSKKEDDLNKKQEKLAQERAVLSPDAFEKKAKEFRAEANAAQHDVKAKSGELENALFTATNDIQKTVLDIVSKIAKQRGYTLVLPTSQLLYADSKLDITNDVLNQLNATLPKVNVSFKAPASSTGKLDQ